MTTRRRAAGPRSLSLLDVRVERPVAGGRMLARDAGRVVLVAGAIPGERVRARVTRTARQVAWADAVEILEPAPSRREPVCDPACGGLAFAHIAYDHQLHLKAEIIADAFRRVGRMPLTDQVPVAASPEDGFRMRARLHVRNGRLGLFREGTHVLCDAEATRQFHPETIPAATQMLSRLGVAGADVDTVLIAENADASDRVLQLETAAGRRLRYRAEDAALPPGVTGLSTSDRGRFHLLAGSEHVTDSAEMLFGREGPVRPDVVWRRRPSSFFQGNRFLIGPLVRHVLECTSGGRACDLYAGVGLFAISLAATGVEVTAVEGDRSSAEDLEGNAAPWASRLTVVQAAVEDSAAALGSGRFDTCVVDPPRTGLSTEAVAIVTALGARRIVYVSCDPATLARDAARLADTGYRRGTVRAFDLFPNTAHIETVTTFDLDGR